MGKRNASNPDLLPGTLDILILKTLTRRPAPSRSAIGKLEGMLEIRKARFTRRATAAAAGMDRGR
jgi:hypothetical protein